VKAEAAGSRRRRMQQSGDIFSIEILDLPTED